MLKRLTEVTEEEKKKIARIKMENHREELLICGIEWTEYYLVWM